MLNLGALMDFFRGNKKKLERRWWVGRQRLAQGKGTVWFGVNGEFFYIEGPYGPLCRWLKMVWGKW